MDFEVHTWAQAFAWFHAARRRVWHDVVATAFCGFAGTPSKFVGVAEGDCRYRAGDTGEPVP